MTAADRHTPQRQAHAVRPAVPDDATAVATVQVAGWRSAYARILPPAELAGLSVTRSARMWREVIEGSARSGKQVLVAAQPDGEVTGFSAFGPERETSGPAPATAELYAFYVHPRHWRQGIGDMLMADTLPLLQQREERAAKLWVYERNAAARAFYQRHGWRHDARTPPAGSTPQELELCYRLRLTAPRRPRD